MFVYEKDGKLNIAFQKTQIVPETPDIVLEKDGEDVKVTVGESSFPEAEEESGEGGGSGGEGGGAGQDQGEDNGET